MLRPKPAGVSSDALQAGQLMGSDCTGRPIVGIWVPVSDVRLPGAWPSLGDGLIVSDWIDRVGNGGFFDPNGPHIDGVLAPIRLAGPERVVVIDFATNTLSIGSWKDAEARMADTDQALTLSSTPIADTKLVVPAEVGGRKMRLALDTGAALSALFVPRDADLPQSLSRTTMHPMQVRVGEVESTAEFTLLEEFGAVGLEEPTERRYDGLLGMDVLRSCVLALDDSHFRVRCRRALPPPTSFDLGTMRCPPPKQPVVQAGTAALPLLQRADGGYDWKGRHLAARIHKDGRVSYSKAPPRADGYEPRDADDERRWFEEQTRDLLIELGQTHDRQVILEALDALPDYLAAILDDRRFSLAQRRHVLFLLWDEMAEPDDRERGWAGTRARAVINAFIRKRLPPGSPGAYSTAEVAAFNGARGRGPTFAPYAPTDQNPVRDRIDE